MIVRWRAFRIGLFCGEEIFLSSFAGRFSLPNLYFSVPVGSNSVLYRSFLHCMRIITPLAVYGTLSSLRTDRYQKYRFDPHADAIAEHTDSGEQYTRRNSCGCAGMTVRISVGSVWQRKHRVYEAGHAEA
jgi:hypothetical protein